MKRNLRSLLAVAIAASLAGCNSADNVAEVAGTNSNAYMCDASMMTQSDDLRIYQIMVESFVNGDNSIGHGTGYGTSHHKGDLQGIIDSLDYIESLGMNAIWLTPIFDSVPIEGQDHWRIGLMQLVISPVITLLSIRVLARWNKPKSWLKKPMKKGCTSSSMEFSATTKAM